MVWRPVKCSSVGKTPALFPHITETCPCNNAAISKSAKNDNFQMKKCDIVLIFPQNIARRYILEAVLKSNNNLCFGAKIRQICIPL